MDHLPSDPAMLVSAVNMLLRDDEFDSLQSLCYYFDREPEELQATLRNEGYEYNAQQRQLRPIM